MNKGMIFLGVAGLGVIGFLGYKLINKVSDSSNGVSPLIPGQPKTYSNSGTQNSGVAPRVDNANQPWYGGPSLAPVSQQAYDMKNIASYLDSGSSIIHSISDIWGDMDLGSMFGQEDSWDEVAAMDWDTPISWDANDSGMGPLETGEETTDTMYAYV